MRTKLRALKAEIFRDIQETFSYKIGILSDIIILMILYLSLIFLDTGTRLELYYDKLGNSKALLLLGYIFWSYSIAVINRVSGEIRAEALKGTLQKKFMAVVPFNILLFGSIISDLLVHSLVAAVIILVSTVFAGVNFIFSWPILFILLITITGMCGIALIFGGLTLRVKKIGQLVFIIQILLLFISDTLTKTSFSDGIGRILPLTTGIDLARKAAGGLEIYMKDWVILLGISLFWLVLGLYIFNKNKDYVKKHGLLKVY